FAGSGPVPLRLPDRVTPKLSLWDIDGSIVTQLVRIWEDQGEAGGLDRIKYSVIVVCSRYARRLEAALQAIAHQRDFDLSLLEVIIAYVPGIDAVDDVIESMQLAHPDLRILRSTFSKKKMRAKGFLINESLKLASGEWIVLMDADAVVAPDMFARVDGLEKSAHFIVPDGRKMLSPEVTARILLGEIKPWEQWDELLKGPGEYRRREAGGIPIGFCQLVRAECIDAAKYAEMNHFEYSDMWFSMTIREKFGAETWLTGAPVAHLDHGGSQWYGTESHR
ncbi:MAG TPA: glycosyltransferase, partial [Candidatus Hydrogenedentes bacterium]|nr:glycosyltransferase [Candidatus Hydrogenedentota bacterium]